MLEGVFLRAQQGAQFLRFSLTIVDMTYLFRKRISILKPDTFNELLFLNSNSKILHTSKTSGITVSFEVN